MHELKGNLHMHTPYSDGTLLHAEIAGAAARAGLDFVIVTDHNVWVDGLEGYYETDQGRVLLLVGEEVHDRRRKPQGSHFLVYGAEREMSPFAHEPQRLIDETNQAGGYGFLAHPHEQDVPIWNERNLGWHDWEIDGFTGLELWNTMSSFKNRFADRLNGLRFRSKLLGQLAALRMAFYPDKVLTFPEAETLALWDELLAQGKRVAAVGNSDAHGTLMSLGPIRRVIFPYDYLFRAVNTHVLTPEPLSGDFETDKRMILKAIGGGHGWIGYDLPQPTNGFRFTGQGVNRGTMGDEIRLDVGATLQVKTPVRANIRLIGGGQVVAEARNETTLTHIPVETGAYRVECHLPFEGQMRGWIYSNPIYLI